MVRIVQRVAQRVNRRRMMDRINNGCRAGAYRRTTPMFDNGLFGQSFQTVLRAFTITLFRFVSVLLRHQDFFRHVTRMGPSGPWQRDGGRQGAPTPIRRIHFTSGNQGWRRRTHARRGPNGEARIRPTTRGTAFAIEKMFHGGCQHPNVFATSQRALYRLASRRRGQYPGAGHIMKQCWTGARHASQRGRGDSDRSLLTAVFVTRRAGRRSTGQSGRGKGKRDNGYDGRLRTKIDPQRGGFAWYMDGGAVGAGVGPFRYVAR